jgi:hypothetical protein
VEVFGGCSLNTRQALVTPASGGRLDTGTIRTPVALRRAARVDSCARWDRRAVDELTLGVLATSGKEHERRLPIHPRHLERIDADVRSRTFLERG